MNYQTEKVDFGNTPTTSPTPTPTPTPEPTPTPKKDEAVVSSVEFKKVENKKDEATVSLVFSKLELADASKKIFVLEVTKKGETTPIQASDLKYDEASKTLSGKLSNLKEGSYTLSKLTLNETNVDLTDAIKNQELKIEATNEQSDQPSDPQKNKEAKIKELQEKLEATKKELEKAKEDENAKKKVADATIETLNKAEASKNEQSIKDAKEKSTKANSDYKKAKELVLEKEAALNLIKEELKELGVKIEDDAGSTGK
ncbi:conserved hypothetical protein [Ureaplasma urealyticum serovar 11 str. ATCC 33695]|uniref:DUF1410 domain-containing protein n=1 Tax=Ureaplasma urealyticum TaxID=2130 RepID=UPI000169E23B|nr:DUF1410 domain-containing protein [Ureaplasma urealyticum]EDU67300.1 conserved hypothetical protein [Ureaplasma urealyticum serovar 11 str. ATCC 33695]